MYNSSFGLEETIETCDLSMQSKYFLMLVDPSNSKENNALPESNLLDNAVDQLNDSDTELLNLLTAEDDCTAILQNIASNEQFERLINNDTDFTNTDFMDSANYCDKIVATIPNLSQECLNTLPPEDDVNLNIPEDITEKKEMGKFKCAHCYKVCTTKKMLRYHLMTHSGNRPYSCEICNKTFKQKYEVTAHKRGHDKPTFQCDICSKMFVHKSHLTAHRRKHVGDFVAFCKECNKGFVSLSVYKNHIKVHHEKNLHICDICGQQLSSLSGLNEHKMIHEANYGKERTHVCDICGKTYLTGRNLKTHMKIHLRLNSFICNICGKSLSGKKVLETHVKMHLGEKDYICSYCNKAFSCKEYLLTHERTHTGDKPFHCHICNKSFTQRTSLTVHFRYHSGARPYKCHCGKGFITKNHLMGHYKTHDNTNLDFDYIAQQI